MRALHVNIYSVLDRQNIDQWYHKVLTVDYSSSPWMRAMYYDANYNTMETVLRAENGGSGKDVENA